MDEILGVDFNGQLAAYIFDLILLPPCRDSTDLCLSNAPESTLIGIWNRQIGHEFLIFNHREMQFTWNLCLQGSTFNSKSRKSSSLQIGQQIAGSFSRIEESTFMRCCDDCAENSEAWLWRRFVSVVREFRSSLEPW
nr:hypothetical protein Iba_chr09dCG1640 [Ipomoea batatas]